MTTQAIDPLSVCIQSIGDVEKFVLSLVRSSPRAYRERAGESLRQTLALLNALGIDPCYEHAAHIAGSKGKGSVALMLEALLNASGQCTGTFTSPHLRSWNERFRIASQPVDDDALIDTMQHMQTALRTLGAHGEALPASFFDVLTAAAMWLFKALHCDHIILECGIGGRYDATNVVTPGVCCITSIELEHVDKLGETLADIAWHKAGIAKPGVPLICAALPPAALNVIRREAERMQAPLIVQGEAFDVHSHPSGPYSQQVELHRDQGIDSFQLPHPAPHMATNAALALMLFRTLSNEPPPLEALARVELPARAQRLRESPTIIVDGAHTEASLDALARCLEPVTPGRRRFLVASSGTKSLKALAQVVCDSELVVTTTPDALRSTDAQHIAQALRPLSTARVIVAQSDPRQALALVLDGLDADQLLCICGSVYLAGWALKQLAPP